MIESNFKNGDIIRHKKEQRLLYIISSEYKSEWDRSGRYDEFYEWYDYKCFDITNNKDIENLIHDHDLINNYDIIMHRFIYEDVKPFMKVLVFKDNIWSCDFISNWVWDNITTLKYNCLQYSNVIPFNNKTEIYINSSNKQTMYHHFSNKEEIYDFSQNNNLLDNNIYKKIK